MIWAGIIDNKIIGPFRLPNGIKIISHNYCNFLKEKVFPALQNLGDDVTNNIIFQQDNTPSHASRYSKSFLENNGFKDERYMDLPPNSPDLNCIENLWAMIKRDVYRDGSSLTQLKICGRQVRKPSLESHHRISRNLQRQWIGKKIGRSP